MKFILLTLTNDSGNYMSPWLRRFRRTCSVLLISTLTACVATPRAEFDPQKLAQVRTVAVAVPATTTYLAGSAGAPIVIPGAGALAAAIGGAVSGAISASTSKRTVTFNELVAARLGDTNLSRRFEDGIEAELRNQGYVVKEIDLSQDGMPKLSFIANLASLNGQKYSGADAILVINLQPQYFAPGPLNSYTRQVTGEVTLFDASSYKVTFRRALHFLKFNDAYSYGTFSSLLDDLPHAIQGVDDAAMSLVPQFGTLLTNARQTIQASNTSGAKAQ